MILTEINDWFVLGGRLHPLIVHLPIGILVIGAFFEFLTILRKYAVFKEILPWIWGFGAITSGVASIAGLLLAQEGGYENDVLQLHQWLGISVIAVTIVLWILRLNPTLRNAYSVGVALFAVVLVSITGHLGGTLTHGEDFLMEPLYTAIGIREEEEMLAERIPIENVEEAVVYTDLVRPVLEQKCIRCHGSKKQKGKLRLDDYQHIVAGGEEGESLKAGDAAQSELYKRLILPDDHDDKMPPRGKPQLTKDEIQLIHWWIQEASASPDKKVSEVIKPEPIQVVLAALSAEAVVEKEEESELPDTELPELDEVSLRPLKDLGVVVNKFSPQHPFITVNCVNAEGFTDEHTKLLLPLREYIVWLKAGNTKITDNGMANILQLKHLTRLALENNDITDKGIADLKQLQDLKYVNLVGTKVTGASVSALSKCNNLRSVYLWRTPFTSASASALQKALPLAQVNTGE